MEHKIFFMFAKSSGLHLIKLFITTNFNKLVSLTLRPNLIEHLKVSYTRNGTAHFKNVNNCLITNIYSYLETTGGKSCNLYINVVHFFNASVN